MATEQQIQYYNEATERAMGFAASVNDGVHLHLSGVISTDAEMNIIGAGDMAEQMRHVYQVIGVILQNNGLGFEHVVNEMIFVTDLAGLADPAAAGERLQCYANCAPPAATAVQVSGLINPEAMIEVQITARLP